METTNKYVFVHPTRCLISGPSACGKTLFVQKVIFNKEKMFTVNPSHIIYVYKYPQKWFVNFPNVQFTKQIPQLLDSNVPSLIVLDDVVCDAPALKECASLFVRGSHHMNASVFFITQNLFAGSNHFRTISLNASQFILFKTIRGMHQIETLGRQIYKNNLREFLEVYKDATSEPYSYLLLDLHPTQKLRLRSHIFPNEEEIVYEIE